MIGFKRKDFVIFVMVADKCLNVPSRIVKNMLIHIASLMSWKNTIFINLFKRI